MGLEKPQTVRPHDETDPGRDTIPMDHYDRYLLPDPSGERDGAVPWTRSSTVKGRVQNSEALKAYNEKMIAKGFAISPDLVALVASTPLSARGAHQVLMEAIEQAKIRAGARVAANFGTALHNFTEQIDMGEPLEEVLERVPEALRADVIAYVDMLERHGLTPVPEYVERVVVNTKLATGLTHDGKPGKRKDAAAGTAARFDRMYLWTDPADGVEYLVPGDLKSGKNAVEYGSLETCVQIATAVHADWMWNEDTDSYEPMPPTAARSLSGADHPGLLGDRPHLRTDFGLIIHSPVGQGRCEPEELDLVLGWRVAQLGVELMLVDKAKAHCHRPFDGKATRTALVAPAPEPIKATKATTTVPVSSQDVVDAQVVAGEPVTPDPGQPSLDALLEAEELDVDAVQAAARREAEARELAPLARDVGASRGCSQCGRTGHRANSRKCLHLRDPQVRADKAIATRELQGRTPEATVPVPDGVIACGPDGAVTELTLGDAAVVEEFAQQLQTMAKRGKPCSHSEGYSRGWARWDDAGNFILAPAEPGEDAPWLCPDCGQESPKAAEARQARAAMNGTPAADAQAVLDERTPAIPDETRSTDEDQGEALGATADDPADALPPEPAPAGPRDLMAEIAECQDREDLQALRRSGMADGSWTPEHTKAGVARLREISAR